jgi:cold shock protein
MNGKVKNKTDKGFGFIIVDGQEKELFFHSNSLVGVTFDELQPGDELTFDIEDSPKGKNAVNVKRA